MKLPTRKMLTMTAQGNIQFMSCLTHKHTVECTFDQMQLSVHSRCYVIWQESDIISPSA